MIFLTGRHHGQDVVLAMPSATLRSTQGQLLHQHAIGDTALACFGQIPWIDRQGVRRAQQRQSNDVADDGDNGNSDGSDANDKDGGDNGNNDKGDINGDDGGDDDYNNDDVNDVNDNDGQLRCNGDEDDGTMRMEQRRCDGNGLMSAVPPIRVGNNQLMSTVWRGVDEREGQFWGTEGQKRVDVEAIRWRSLHLHWINSKSTFRTPRVANAWDPIPHVSWEKGCAISAK
jgi:hypothetical protein